MRLKSIMVRDTPPVELFEVGGLADVVVIAGPNGVGKTRLLETIVAHLRGAGSGQPIRAVIEATVSAERDEWGKAELDMAVPEDVILLAQTLQGGSRKRRNWTSSLVNFESDRTIRTLQPLTFTWDMPDPAEEPISWDMTFGFMRDRFQDTVHSMFRMIETQKQSIASRAVRLRREGHGEMKLEFKDPMEPFKEVFSMLLAPKQLVDPSARTQRLEYILDGEVFPFETLSSGEREVVNTAFDFLLRQPRDCMVFFDEPELHLHPELSYKLLQTLRTIGERNQFFLSTHSPDVITASLDQSVVFLAPSRADAMGAAENQAVMVSESDETNQALRLLGQSIGIVALGKRIVLIEGERSSLDKQTYGSILAGRHADLVLVPSGGRDTIESFEHVYEAVLSKTIWGVEFFMLCDRDSRPAESEKSEAAQGEGRLAILPRYHLENYFLDEAVWARAFAQMEAEGSPLRQPAEIRKIMRECASELVSYAAALAAAHLLRQRVGNIDAMPKSCHGKSLDELRELILARVGTETERVVTVLDADAVTETVTTVYERLSQAVTNDDESWKADIPGKPLLGMFAGRTHVGEARGKSLYMNVAAASEENPFAEILPIFDRFASA